jgi:hypothetical protein
VLKDEVKRQLFETFGIELPKPDSIILYPEIKYDTRLKKWTNKHISFFKPYNQGFIPFKIPNMKERITFDNYEFSIIKKNKSTIVLVQLIDLSVDL